MEGPTLQTELLKHIPIQTTSPKLSAVDKLKNYTKQATKNFENYLEEAHISEYKLNRLDLSFSKSFENFEIQPESRCHTRKLLKNKLNLAYTIVDCLGSKGVKALDWVWDSFCHISEQWRQRFSLWWWIIGWENVPRWNMSKKKISPDDWRWLLRKH